MRKIPLYFLFYFLLSGFLVISVASEKNVLEKAILKLDEKILNEEAKKASNNGNLALAGKLYFKLAEYYELKSSGKKSREWKKSEEYLDKSIELLRKASKNNNLVEVHFDLVRALIYRIRHYGGLFDLYQIITKGKEATKEIEKIKKSNPKSYLVELALGIQTLYKPENMEGGILNAIPHFEKAKEAAPDNAEVLYWFGRAYSLEGAKGEDKEKAVTYLKKAIEMNPEDVRYSMELEKISSIK
ncbi:MAG: tetratricopeptide repeat protein [Candidatus Schekmanbacteria bacterium]|nr:MAG: tetratricopeptide repeat protein [Candidatus Schekmanbacteria bacterium]